MHPGVHDTRQMPIPSFVPCDPCRLELKIAKVMLDLKQDQKKAQIKNTHRENLGNCHECWALNEHSVGNVG